MATLFWKLRTYFIPLVAGLASCAAYAQETNGCGTGWNRYLVPDRIKLIGCDFKQACDSHDVCYGKCSTYEPGKAPKQCEYLRCETNGDLVGRPICDSIGFRENRIAAEERRAKCDATFMIDISRTNPDNPRCDFFSGLYPFAVRVLGGKNFLGMDSLDQVSMSETDKTLYAKAINELLETWPDNKISDLANKIRKGTSGIDLSKPLFFDPEKGLVNK